MFKDRSITEVIYFALIGAVLLFGAAAMTEHIYIVSTRPPGHECKEGETKPPSDGYYGFACDNGYWMEFPPGSYWMHEAELKKKP